jgi:hypothetical protein
VGIAPWRVQHQGRTHAEIVICPVCDHSSQGACSRPLSDGRVRELDGMTMSACARSPNRILRTERNHEP